MSKILFFSLIAIPLTFNPITFNYPSESPEKVYLKYCSGCHGTNLEDFKERDWKWGNGLADIKTAITNGYKNEGMPEYGSALPESLINDLSSFILEESKKPRIVKERKYTERSEIIQSRDLSFTIETVVDNMDVPWGLAFLPGDDLLITERDGDFYRFSAASGLTKIEDVPQVVARGQGGLMDIEIHPDFENNRFIYLSYSKKEPGGNKATTAVVRATLENNKLVDPEDIFIALPYEGTRHHYGSRLEFDEEGFLYISVGDRGQRDKYPQKLDNSCGKIHRVHDDGRIPQTNPFVNTPGAIRSIFSYGHRNPQGLVINKESGALWSNEHGPRGGDEMNSVQAGKNYGWPVISYGINYNGTSFTNLTHKAGMEQPEHYWDPSIGVCGLDFVYSWRYPEWQGDALAGSLRFEYLARLIIEDGKIIGEEKLLEDIGRLRDVKMGRDGYIYVSVEDPGRVLRIVPVK